MSALPEPTCPDDDHDWHYEAGESDVGIPPCWVCRACGKCDVGRDEPDNEDDWQ